MVGSAIKIIIALCAAALSYLIGTLWCQASGLKRIGLRSHQVHATVSNMTRQDAENGLPNRDFNSEALSTFTLPPPVVTYNDTNPLSCFLLVRGIVSSRVTNGRVLCRLRFTEFFQKAVIKESLLIVDTNSQPFDGYLWHRCVVFGRFEKVATKHLGEFDGNGEYNRSLLMVRGDFRSEWTKFKRLTKRSPGILLWADETCQPTVNISEAKYAFRHYGCLKDTSSNYIPNGFWRWKFGNAPSLGARENQISPDSSCDGMSDILKSSARRHFYNWQGTIRRNRGEMINSAQRQYKTSSSADARYYISQRGNGFDGDGPSFQDAVANSAFTLCPCGNNAETHRLWEALLAGSIPIQEDCADTESQAKFISFVRRVLPEIIIIKNWNDLHLVLDEYEKDTVRLNLKQMSLYSAFMNLIFRIGMDSGDIVAGYQHKITWPNGASAW
jgi:hypothetical protein